MTRLTRRGLLRRTTLGTAAAAALLLTPGRAFAQTSASDAPSGAQTSPDHMMNDGHEPLGAFVHDVSTGEITLLAGARELRVRDPELVRRLVQAAR